MLYWHVAGMKMPHAQARGGLLMNKKNTISMPTQKYLLWIILIAVIVRIFLMIILQSWEFNGERYGHRAGEIGYALASGQGFSWPEDSTYVPENAIKKTSWEAPVYPLIFAAVFKVFGIYSHTSAVILILFQISESSSEFFTNLS